MSGKDNTKPFSRRSFIKGTAVLGASSLLGSGGLGWMQKLAFADTQLDLAAVKGADYYQNTMKAVALLGGMSKFVSRQSKVALLINSGWRHPGSFVNPDVTLAVVHMCLEAGAKDVGAFKRLTSSYWRRGSLSPKYSDEVKSIQFVGGGYTDFSLPGGRSLKKAEIAGALLEWDVFINISIPKDHTGVRFSCTMKNMMGATSRSTNNFFHRGSGAVGFYEDAAFLSQCIADVNLVRKPQLCVADGTEMLTTNGPNGPGKLVKPQTVFAGVDRVAVDVYGAQLLGLKSNGIKMIQMAHEHGLGEADLTRLRIKEMSL